ncbi:MAG: HAMP domain-containing sensor histidine kinase [Pseudomonadota bacterium]
MPRFDDRLKNVLALIDSNEHSNNDTVFRHICDILLQEGLWMDKERRETLVAYLADYYVKASQPARMEIADITSRVADAPVEIIALVAADADVVGNRLWDRVRLAGDDWSFMLPRLSRAALGRLRARMNLTDAVSVAVDREWRERIRRPDHTLADVDETARSLKGIHDPVEDTQENVPAALANTKDDESLIVEDEAPASQNTIAEDDHEEAAESEQEHVLEDAEQTGADTETQNAGTWLPENGGDANDSGTDRGDFVSEEDKRERLRLFVSDPQVIELAAVREQANQASREEDVYGDEVDAALGDDPEVEDPKIQDILQRLRDFGTRSKELSETPQPEDVNEASFEEAQDPTEDTPPVEAEAPALFGASGSAAERSAADTKEPSQAGASLSLFAPSQPSETDEHAETLDKKPAERVRGPLSVNGLSPVFGARWATDRFGSLVEAGPYGIDMFGLPAQNTIGEILSSLFNIQGRRELDKLLSARRGFRDLKVISVVGEQGWSLSGVAVFDDESGIFLGFRGTANPDAEFAQSEAERAAKDQTSDQDNEATVFDVTGLAHELKTPLNAIRGFAEMIQTQQLGETSAFAQHRSAHIGRQAQRLSNVLDDLLLQSKAQSSDEAPQPTTKTPILEVLTRALADFDGQHVLTERMSRLDPGLSTPIDERIAGRMIERLVFYAAQWTPSGRPVTLRFDPPDEEGGAISMSARLPGWSGSNSQSDLLQVSDGPRLPYNHPLADVSLEGRSLADVQEDLEAVGARLELIGGGGKPVSLSLFLPVNPDE